MIDWKNIPKIDAHIHLTPNDVIEANKEYDDPFIQNGNVSDYFKIMDEYKIEQAFIMPFNDTYMLSMDFTIESVHKNMLEMVNVNNEKLKCFADIDIRRSINDTLSELDNILKNENMIGIKLHATNTGYPIDGDYYDQIINYAVQNNILVEIHSYPREHLIDDVCSPQRIRNLVNKYPDLRLSIAHLGGMQYEELKDINAYFNISAILTDLVNKFGLEKSNQILRSFDLKKLIFATDYPDNRCLKPNEIYDKYFEILSKMDFTYEEALDICKNNALRMIEK